MKAALGCLELRYNAGRIIGSKLLVTDAAGPSAHRVVGRFERNRFETGRVIWTDGGGNYIEEGRAGGSDTKGPLCSNKSGAEVEGVTAGAGSGGARISARAGNGLGKEALNLT